MKSTKFLAALLAVMMIFGTFAASAAGFTDITLESNPEAYKNALLLNQMGVVKGDENGNANLDKPVTRAEMAAFIFRLGTAYTDIVGGVNSTTFEDLEADGWYISNVVWCYEQGIIAGRDPESKIFDPKADVSYDEAIKMVVTLLGYKGLSYPLGYYLKFLDLLKAADTTLAKVLPEYKGDVAGTRNPISRGEVISMLNVAFKAPMADEKGKASEYTLQNSVWANSDTSIKEYYAVVVANEKKALPGFSATAAAGKVDLAVYTTDSNGVKSLGTEVIADQAAAADYGLAADVEIGTYFTYYKMGTADEVKAGNGDIVKELTTTATSAVIEDASISIAEKTEKVNNTDTKVQYVTINGKEMKASTEIYYTAEYISASATPYFKGTASALTDIYDAVKANKDIYVVAYDLFADGSIDYVDYSVKGIAQVGDNVKSPATASAVNATEFYVLDTNAIALGAAKLSTLKNFADLSVELIANVDNKVSAVKGDLVALYAFNGKVIVDEKISTFKGTVTKVVDAKTFTVKKADGTKVDLTIAAGEAPLVNIAVSKDLASALVATTTTNFIVYGDKIVATYIDEDAPAADPVYNGTKVAVFYGLGNRTVSFTQEYVETTGGFNLVYKPSYVYNALVAYEDDLSKVVSIPVSAINGFAYSASVDVKVDTVNLFTAPTAAKPANLTAEAVVNGLATDGSEIVVVTADKKDDGTLKGTYTIDDTFELAQLSKDTKESLVKVDAGYITQNALTGYYELRNASGTIVKYFLTDDASVVIGLTTLATDNKKNVIDAASEKVAKYSAAKISLATISGKKAFVAGESAMLTDKDTSVEGNFMFEVKDGVNYLRKAIVTTVADKVAAGQLVATAVDTTKAPFTFSILTSIDSISVEDKKATVEYSVYNPALNTFSKLSYTVSGDTDAKALEAINTYADTTLAGNLGKVVTAFESDGKIKTTVAFGEYDSLTTESKDGVTTLKNFAVNGTIKKFAASSNGYYITVDDSETILNIAKDCKIISLTADSNNGSTLYDKLTVKTDAKTVEVKGSDDKYTFALENEAGITLFVDSSFNVVFAIVGDLTK